MKRFSFLCLVASLLLTTSCNKEDAFYGTSGLYTLTGTVEDNNPTTRAGFDMDNNGSFFWNSGDAIAVGSSSFAKYTTDCNDKSTSATFTSLSPASGYAIYPYERAQSISENNLNYEFASEYNYTTVDTDFFNGMSVDIPMWAKVEGNTLSFKHLGGVFAFKFPNLKAGDNQTFTMTADSKISGAFTADLSVSEPVFATSTADVADADKKVTINFSLKADADAVFYVPVPVGTYAVKVEVKNGSESFSQEWKGLTVNRRDIRYTTLTAHSLQGSEAKVVSSAEDVAGAMEANTNVVLENIQSESSNSTVSIELPKKSANSEVAHSLSIGSIDANTTTIEIKESDTDDDGSSISELVVSVPTTDDAKKLVIDMPNTTVSIIVAGMESLTLSEVEASTAENTLIVGKGVTVKNLIVKGGNVRVQGTVSAISRAEENADEVTYLIYEEGAQIPTSLGENIVAVSAAEWDLRVVVTSNDELSAALSNNEVNTIVLAADLTLTEILSIERTLTLDGNGKTLTYTGTDRAFQITGGTVVIQNLTVKTPNAPEGGRGINLYNGGTNSSIDVTLNSVTVEGGKAYAVNIGGGKDNKLTINNSTLTGYAAINVNAASVNHTINVDGCTLTGNNHNTGYDFGVVVIDGTNAHTLKIVNTTITPNNNEGVTTVYNQLVVGPNCRYEVDNVTDIAVRNILANGLYYTDLQAAVNEANENSTVTLLGDIQIDAIIEINKSITLDGNGKTLTYTGTDRAFQITGGNVVINNLTIEMPNASEGNRGINLYNGVTNSSIDVTLNGVTVEGGKAYAVNIGGGKDNKLTINNSALTGYAAINVNAASVSHTINVDGCTLTGNNHNTGYDFGVVVIDGTNEHTLKIANTTITPNNNEGVTTVYNQLVVGPNCRYEVDDNVTDIAVRNILANGLYYTDLQAAVNEANENSPVTLLGDIQIDNLVKIEKSITLDLNSKTVSAKCQKAFEIYANATIKNGTIISQQRCVDTRKAVELTLTDLTLNAPTYYAAHGNQQPLTIGGSEGGTKVTMSKVTMDAGTQGYCIISFVKTELTATDSNLSGYSALYVKAGSENSTFSFAKSTLSGTTGSNDVEGNSFATIAIEANSVTVTMDNDCTLNSTGTYHRKTYIGEGVTGSSITSPAAE